MSAERAHRESPVQEHLVQQLVALQGYMRRDPNKHYDKALAMDRDMTLAFIKTSQPQAWEQLSQHYAESAEDTFFTQLAQSLKKHGLLSVLRQGIKIVPGIPFSLCHFRPASGLEPKRMAEYEANILSVMDEVEYSQKNGNRIDVVLFLNGLPIVTIEVKNKMTETTFRHAEKQYKEDRPPAGEPLLTFKRGALVHFALDEYNASMTTRLQKAKTRFLYFNRGSSRLDGLDGGAGNPDDIENENPIAYFYSNGEWGDAIFSRAVLIDVIGKFMHLESKGKNQSMIFPRFHQLDAVQKLTSHAQAQGPGQNYLIQHSTGSGKSNTIAWLAHQVINLHDSEDRQIFHTAIVVTDRRVLNSQLQTIISQFEQTQGVVKNIDGTSRQLKEAIESGARIIVTTIQKFTTDHLKAVSGQSNRNFAVIIDEAHSSQSGKSAQYMVDALTRDAESSEDVGDLMAEYQKSSEDVEDLIAEYQKSRGPQANISYFAFTATPRNVTLERFGVKQAGKPPQPFHLYSMRQAIEEKYIIDVLKNCMSYESYYELEKAIADDPLFRERRGQRTVAKWASLHPTAIGQKAEIMVEHFRRHVMKMLEGQAKAMIVTQSREHARRYYLAVIKYIEEQGYSDMKTLVAFSGELKVDGVAYTEAGINGFSEKELPTRFGGIQPDGTEYPDNYQFLIVAEKYQTGFDQPKLCAMYVDRKLAGAELPKLKKNDQELEDSEQQKRVRELEGLQAVQTLSRLNRTHTGKDKTFVLLFRNTIEDIQIAFKPWFEETTLEASTDPNQIYDLERRLYASGYLKQDEIERFAEIYFKGNLKPYDRVQLEGLVRLAVQRFDADDDEGRQDEFRQLLRSYGRFYAFIAQIITLDDTSLEKLDAYGSWLLRLLPSRQIPPELDITDDMLRLQAFKVEQKEQADASLAPGTSEPLAPISAMGANSYTEDEKKELSEIVRAFNERHGTLFTEADMVRFGQINQEILNDGMVEMLRNNPPDVVYSAFSQAFFQGAIRMFQRDNEMRNIVMTDAEAREQATRFFFNLALREVMGGSRNAN